jgi:Flp pilus assembly protein TadG
VTNNGGSTNYTFTGNGSFTFEFVDSYGNTGSETANVTWIDKTAPSCSVTYSTTGNTNQDVTAMLTGCSEAVTVTNNGGSTNYTFPTNGSFMFEFTDAVGNTGTTMATVTRIDKTPVTGTISYSPNSNTNQDVVASISFNKTGTTVTNNGGSTNYTFTADGSFTFEFVDSYGNT